MSGHVAHMYELERAQRMDMLNALKVRGDKLLEGILGYLGLKLFDVDTVSIEGSISMSEFTASHVSLNKLGEGAAAEYFCEMCTLVTDIKICVERLESNGDAYLDLAYSISYLARSLAYRAVNKSMFRLPKPDYAGDMSDHYFSTHQPCIAERILWLEKRKADGLELYPNERRYATTVGNYEGLREQLNQKFRLQYLDVNFNEYRSVEWDTFYEIVAYLTYTRQNMKYYIDGIRRELDERSTGNGNDAITTIGLDDDYDDDGTSSVASAPWTTYHGSDDGIAPSNWTMYRGSGRGRAASPTLTTYRGSDDGRVGPSNWTNYHGSGHGRAASPTLTTYHGSDDGISPSNWTTYQGSGRGRAASPTWTTYHGSDDGGVGPTPLTNPHVNVPKAPSECPPLDTFTTPCTEEAMAPADEADRRCYVCYFDFGPVYSEENETEPAVRTICGHVHGAVCLKREVESGKTTCAICRKDLFGWEQCLSTEGARAYRDILQVVKDCEELDQQVDDYLFEGYKETHSPEFGDLMHKLADLVTRMSKGKSSLWDSLST